MPRANRLERIFEHAGGVDVVAIVNGSRPDPNFFYISGYRNGLFEGSLLFLFRGGRVEVVTNPLEEGAAREKKEFKVHVDRGADPMAQQRIVSSILKGRSRVGINFRGISHRDYLGLRKTMGARKLVDVSEALGDARLVKDPDELQAIARAARIVSSVVDEVPEMLAERMTERELKSKIDYLMVAKGADSPSFDSIVAFGEDSAIPHHSAGERALRRGDNVLVDVGARYSLYCSDITRTFFFGRPAKVQEEAYAKVLEAQTKAMDAVREGATGRDIHNVAASIIDKSRFKGKFTHGLGHSLGLEVHDGPGLSPKNRDRLRRNMVVTVEPGIYLEGRGGVRIEDDVVVTKDACRQLTTSPKEPIQV